MESLIQDLVDALSLGSFYSLLALGIALIFGVMGLINFAHGSLIMIGAYVLFAIADLPFLALAAITVAAVVFSAVGMERVAFRPVRSADPTTLLAASFALAFMLEHLALLLAGARPKGVDVLPSLQGVVELGGVRIQVINLVVVGAAVVLVLGLGALLKRTRIGVQMRAAAEDFEAARLMGVRSDVVIATAFAISGVLAAVAAIFLVAEGGTVYPTIGLQPVLIAFVAVVIGGLASLRGAVVGAFVLGFLTVALQAWLPSGLTSYRDFFVYAAVILILLLKPEGMVPSRSLRGRVG